MATTNRKTRAKRTQPKKCIQTTCGNTCIPKSKTCRITDPNAKKKIRQKGKELVDRIQDKPNSKTRVDRTVEKAVTKPKAKNSSKAGKLAYEKLTKEAKTGTKRSKTDTYNQGLAILGKYGGKDDSRARVDRDVEKASAKTRRKPQTENEKTQKVLRREEAQRVLRELQGEKTSSKPEVKSKVDTQSDKGYKGEKTTDKAVDTTVATKKEETPSKPQITEEEKQFKGKNHSKWRNPDWFDGVARVHTNEESIENEQVDKPVPKTSRRQSVSNKTSRKTSKHIEKDTEINQAESKFKAKTEKQQERSNSAYDRLKAGGMLRAKGRDFRATFPNDPKQPVKITSGTLEYELKNDEYTIKSFLERLTK